MGQVPPLPGRIEIIPFKNRTLTGKEFLRGDVQGTGCILAGELRLPPSATPADGAEPVAAVVLVHGSGGISGVSAGPPPSGLRP